MHAVGGNMCSVHMTCAFDESLVLSVVSSLSCPVLALARRTSLSHGHICYPKRIVPTRHPRTSAHPTFL